VSTAWFYISGFNLLTGQSVSYNGTAFIRLKPWDQRKARSESVDSLVRTLMGRLNAQSRTPSARPQPAAASGA